jgi:hypothetical protein
MDKVKTVYGRIKNGEAFICLEGEHKGKAFVCEPSGAQPAEYNGQVWNVLPNLPHLPLAADLPVEKFVGRPNGKVSHLPKDNNSIKP